MEDKDWDCKVIAQVHIIGNSVSINVFYVSILYEYQQIDIYDLLNKLYAIFGSVLKNLLTRLDPYDH